jgi:threonine/homoserine/homoserine lactone efflux protein
MNLDTALLYFAAALGLSLTPGPNSLLVLTHGALHGHRRTLATVAGGAIGFALLIGLSMAGIGALLQASAHALTVLKWIGGAYLVWLGIQVWRSPPLRLDLDAAPADAAPLAMFRQGLFTAASNPKGLLFFGAFLPQFIDPARDLWTQFAVMAGLFIAIECVVEFALAWMAQRVRPAIERAGKAFNRVCGGLFVAIGVALPMTK